jgi:hypothetical protein
VMGGVAVVSPTGGGRSVFCGKISGKKYRKGKGFA